MLNLYFQEHILSRANASAAPAASHAVAGSKTGKSSGGPPAVAAVGAAEATAAVAVKSSAFAACRRHNVVPIQLDPALNIGEQLKAVAARTEGFSGRELSKLVLKMQVCGLPAFDQFYASVVQSPIVRVTLLGLSRVLCTALRVCY
jgi:hypothetical protein